MTWEDWLLRYISFAWDTVYLSDYKIFLKTGPHGENAPFEVHH